MGAALRALPPVTITNTDHKTQRAPQMRSSSSASSRNAISEMNPLRSTKSAKVPKTKKKKSKPPAPPRRLPPVGPPLSQSMHKSYRPPSRATTLFYAAPHAIEPTIVSHGMAPGYQNCAFLPEHCKPGYGRNPLGAPYCK